MFPEPPLVVCSNRICSPACPFTPVAIAHLRQPLHSCIGLHPSPLGCALPNSSSHLAPLAPSARSLCSLRIAVAVSTAVLTALKRSINRSAGADTMRLSFLPVSEVSYTTRKASARDSRTVQSKNIITMRFLPSFLAATDAKPVTATNLAKLGQASHFAQKVRRAAGKQGKWPGESKPGGRMGGGSVRGGSVRSAGSVGSRSSRGSRVSQASHAEQTFDVVDRVKDVILSRGGAHGIRGLSRVLKIMDDSGDKQLTKDELYYGLRDYGVDLTPREMKVVMTYFDRDKSGTISFDEFLRGIRGDMNPRRLALVNQAFDILDKTGDGEVTVEDLRDVYSVEKHPGVLEGKLTPDQALAEFLDQWDTVDKDGIVTREEFAEYYAGISASIDGDDYFELMIRNAWHISGGEGWCANTTCRRVLVTHRDGHTSVEEITDDLGVNADDEKAIMASLASRGIRAVKVENHGQAGGAAGKPKRKPPVGVASMFGGGGAPAKAPTRDPHAPHRGMQERDLDASERKQAAQSVQAAFRGLKGRREGERAQRKGVREGESRVFCG